MTPSATLRLTATVLGSIVGWHAHPAPTADPDCVRDLLTLVGVPETMSLDSGVRAFQRHAGLDEDGVAGPRTTHSLARYAAAARERAVITTAII